MGYTRSCAANAVLTDLVSALTVSLADELVGVYLYGSLVAGDFKEGRSDVDLLVVLEQPVDALRSRSLVDLHRRFDADHALWQGRIDIAYVGRSSLLACQSEPYAAIVSDGAELLALVDAPPYYLIDWFKVQQHGLALIGPEVGAVLPVIAVAEFTRAVFDYLQTFPPTTESAEKRGEQAYIVLTMCRSLYACRFATHVSKVGGATWAMRQYPQWRGLIQKALDWNRDEAMNDVLDLPNSRATAGFVDFVRAEATR